MPFGARGALLGTLGLQREQPGTHPGAVALLLTSSFKEPVVEKEGTHSGFRCWDPGTHPPAIRRNRRKAKLMSVDPLY